MVSAELTPPCRCHVPIADFCQIQHAWPQADVAGCSLPPSDLPVGFVLLALNRKHRFEYVSVVRVEQSIESFIQSAGAGEQIDQWNGHLAANSTRFSTRFQANYPRATVPANVPPYIVTSR